MQHGLQGEQAACTNLDHQGSATGDRANVSRNINVPVAFLDLNIHLLKLLLHRGQPLPHGRDIMAATRLMSLVLYLESAVAVVRIPVSVWTCLRRISLLTSACDIVRDSS